MMTLCKLSFPPLLIRRSSFMLHCICANHTDGSIRSLLTDDLKRRRVSGCHQISSDGRTSRLLLRSIRLPSASPAPRMTGCLKGEPASAGESNNKPREFVKLRGAALFPPTPQSVGPCTTTNNCFPSSSSCITTRIDCLPMVTIQWFSLCSTRPGSPSALFISNTWEKHRPRGSTRSSCTASTLPDSKPFSPIHHHPPSSFCTHRARLWVCISSPRHLSLQGAQVGQTGLVSCLLCFSL
jgi:hypothetical protein